MTHITYQRAAEIILGYGVLGFETQMGNPLSRHATERVRKSLMLSHVDIYNSSKRGCVRISVQGNGHLHAQVVLRKSEEVVLGRGDIDDMRSLFEMSEIVNKEKFIVVESRSEREI